MKKIFTLGLAAAMLLLGAETASAQKAKEDYTITGNKTSLITNPYFTADEALPAGAVVNTYDYGMADDGVGADPANKGRFGLQPVSGWTADAPSDNIKVMNTDKDTPRTDNANRKAGGVFAYVGEETEEADKTGLGGAYYAPISVEGDELTTNALGIVAVWGGEAYYQQDITLPAGAYMMVVKVWNAAGTGEFNTVYNGFIADGGAKYLSENKIISTGAWFEDVITFRLTEETSGKISLGYQSGNYGSGSAAHLFIDGVELYTIDPTPLIEEEIAAAKETLFAVLTQNDDIGIDTSDGWAVYEAPNATMEQVQQAIEDAREAYEKAHTDLSAYFLKNAHFQDDEPLPEDEGITTYARDMNASGNNGRIVHHYGMLPLTSWKASHPCDASLEPGVTGDNTNDARACGVFNVGSNSFLGGAAFLPPKALSDGSTEGHLLGFVGVWTAQSQYTQEVTLPAGQYTLEISYYNAGGTGAIAKNLMGFIANDGTEHLGTTTSWAVGKWMKDEINFTLDEPTDGYFSVGYTAANAGSASMPHFFIDGISIYFVGELENPSLIALKAALDAAEKVDGEGYYSALQTQLAKAVSTGQALYDAESNDEAANLAAAEAINLLLPDVNASIKAYQELDDFINGENSPWTAALEKYNETDYPTIFNSIIKLEDDYMDALDNYTLSTEDVYAKMAELPVVIKAAVQEAFDAASAPGAEALKAPLDITPLFEQMAYTYSATAQSGANVPDKEWNYGSTTAFKTQYGTAEVWQNTPFTISRTLAEMPAGTYTLTTKAFYRVADNQTNYDAYEAGAEELANYGKAYLFAGSNKTELTNVAEIAAMEAVEGWADLNDKEPTGIYVPNNQAAAHDVFENAAFTDALQKSVEKSLAEKGDLTFGITADQMESNCWVVWYSFSITYDNTVSALALQDELKSLIEEVTTYTDAQTVDAAINNWASTEAATALKTAQGFITSTDVAKLQQAINDLKANKEQTQKNVELKVAYETAKANLDATYSEYSETASAAAVSDYNNMTKNEYTDDDDKSNSDIENIIERINALIIALKLPDGYELASDAKPVDMTNLIVNPSFEANVDGEAPTGWEYNTKATGDTKVHAIPTDYDPASGNATPNYYIEDAEELGLGLNVFNTWHGSLPDGNFYVKQTLTGLPSGTYELKALFAGDNGNWIGLAANENEGIFTFANAKSVGQYESIFFQVDGGKAVEIKAYSTNWFIADDFTLTYYGMESSKEPTAVEGIEAPAAAAAVIYNTAGQRVDEGYKGIVIKNGKKFLQK